MTCLQRLTKLPVVSAQLKRNKCALVNFLYSRNFCDIKAKPVKINFSTLTEVLGTKIYTTKDSEVHKML